eukprot:1300828-Prymnesium_polylepis.1
MASAVIKSRDILAWLRSVSICSTRAESTCPPARGGARTHAVILRRAGAAWTNSDRLVAWCG